MNQTKKLALAAMFVAIGLVLPLLTGSIPEIGMMLLPMHIPVLFCGLICGYRYGLAVGFVLPLLRAITFGMPPLFPMGISMAFELATYGFVIAIIYGRAQWSQWRCLLSLFCALILAMIAGRVVWFAAMVVLIGISGEAFTWQMFITAAVLNSIPGIILQLVLIPSVMLALNKTGLVPFNVKNNAESVSP